jgi:hypothetical protein
MEEPMEAAMDDIDIDDTMHSAPDYEYYKFNIGMFNIVKLTFVEKTEPTKDIKMTVEEWNSSNKDEYLIYSETGSPITQDQLDELIKLWKDYDDSYNKMKQEEQAFENGRPRRGRQIEYEEYKKGGKFHKKQHRTRARKSRKSRKSRKHKKHH